MNMNKDEIDVWLSLHVSFFVCLLMMFEHL